MRAEIDHRALEARIPHYRHRDQQPAVEITAPRRIVAHAGGFAAANPWFFTFRVHSQRTLTLMHILISGAGSVNQALRRRLLTHHKQFNGLRPCLAVMTSHDRHGSHARRARPGRSRSCFVPGDRGSRGGCVALAAGWALRGPAPAKFDDGAGGHSMGYHDQVVLPLRIVAKNADKPVTLRAGINYAVCEKICIPVEANVELGFTSVASTEDSALFAALDTVPKPASIGDPNPLTIRDVMRDGKSSVLIDVVTPDTREINLFVEGPTPDWALPVPTPLEKSPPGVKRFSFELDGLPPGADPAGAALKLTLVGGDRAYEFNINLE